MGFKGRDILSMQDFSKEEILQILHFADQIKKKHPGPILQGQVMASCFFEPSTRTRLSFESAMKRLGGDVIGFSEPSSTSIKKGESLSDSMRVIGSYADAIVIRHPREGSARIAAEATETPVINGGDGANEHPTQTFLDLFTMKECQGRLEGLNITFVGDLKYGRTVHSLVLALKHFGAKLHFVSPPSLTLSEDIVKQCESFSFHQEIDEVIEKTDILYMTRIQEERFDDLSEYQMLKNSFQIDVELLKKGKTNLKVLHPLPRVGEIGVEIDKTPFAYYFNQAENGLFMRQALLTLLLKGL